VSLPCSRQSHHSRAPRWSDSWNYIARCKCGFKAKRRTIEKAEETVNKHIEEKKDG